MVANWPSVARGGNNQIPSGSFSEIQNIIIAIRNARSENKIEPAKKLQAIIYGHQLTTEIKENEALIRGMKTGLESLEIKEEGEKLSGAIVVIVGEVEIYLLGGIDVDKEKTRLTKELAVLEKLISAQEVKLSNQEFVDRAPAQIVTAEKNKLEAYKLDLEKINQALNKL